jgi:hypothetical protein
VAQLVARFVRNEEARGSNPLSSTRALRRSVAGMALDPEIVELYAKAREAYEAACGDGSHSGDPAVLEARETLRANLSAYILDLEVNGISVPEELTAEMAQLAG